MKWWRALVLRWQRFEVPMCTCLSKRPAFIYDANGHKSWCVDCGGKRR